MARTARVGGGATKSRPDTRVVRRCLAPGHNHSFLTTPNVRLCEVGRRQLAAVDAYFGSASPVYRVKYGRPFSGVHAAASGGDEA